jgi:hypothetical protein
VHLGTVEQDGTQLFVDAGWSVSRKGKIFEHMVLWLAMSMLIRGFRWCSCSRPGSCSSRGSSSSGKLVHLGRLCISFHGLALLMRQR